MSLATIVSQSTPSGFSAIAVIRLSGANALEIAKKISKNHQPFKHRVAEVRNIFLGSDLIDQAVFTAFLSPKSYTGEDVVEFRVMEIFIFASLQSMKLLNLVQELQNRENIQKGVY